MVSTTPKTHCCIFLKFGILSHSPSKYLYESPGLRSETALATVGTFSLKNLLLVPLTGFPSLKHLAFTVHSLYRLKGPLYRTAPESTGLMESLIENFILTFGREEARVTFRESTRLE